MSGARLTRRTVLLGTGAAALTVACGRPQATVPADVVRTASGPVRGLRRDTGFAFLGIPYAQPPAGALRFAAPVAPRPWTETLDCTRYGPTAQRKPLTPVTTIPEPSIPGDAVLNLNVFTPDHSSGAKLPVLVWIHGGGFVAGSAASPWYDGASFNRDGVVVVSIGYRLGLEGFLHVYGAPDNRAVLDWIAALTWVRDNIAAFGGDPGKVTVAGQSAGGGAVWALMAAPSARGLFRAGICASGALTQPNPRAVALTATSTFTRQTGVPATAAALQDLSDDRRQELQSALGAPGPGSATSAVLTLAPFADGELIPESTATLLTTGTGADVPLLLGFTRHEFTMAARSQPAAASIDGAALDRYRPAYPGLAPADLTGQVISDIMVRAPAYRVAEDHTRRGRPTWLYEFAWTSTAPAYSGMAAHCLDLPFAFDLLRAQGVSAALGDTPPQSLADAVHRSWVAFIRDGDPGPTWPRYTLDRRDTMVWTDHPQVTADPFARQRPLWL
ncbi:MAG: carboxylesterase family protein [Mycobacteriaceae bacterium]|nr:carboxylesterase family protein [Mycobacteriaceae bacterium]